MNTCIFAEEKLRLKPKFCNEEQASDKQLTMAMTSTERMKFIHPLDSIINAL